MEKEAKIIVLEFYNLIIECGLVDTSDNGPFDAAKKMASKSVEMLIEALKENIEHGAFTDQNTAIRQQIKDNKEVLKAIKNME